MNPFAQWLLLRDHLCSFRLWLCLDNLYTRSFFVFCFFFLMESLHTLGWLKSSFGFSIIWNIFHNISINILHNILWKNLNELFGQPNTLFCYLLSSFNIFWASLQCLAQLYLTPESFLPMCLVAQLCLTLCDPWTVAYQAPQSMRLFSR